MNCDKLAATILTFQTPKVFSMSSIAVLPVSNQINQILHGGTTRDMKVSSGKGTNSNCRRLMIL